MSENNIEIPVSILMDAINILGRARFQILSDVQCFDFTKTFTVRAEMLAICGNIGTPGSREYAQIIAWASSKYRYVFIVLGNADYYNSIAQKCRDIAYQVC